MHSQNKWKSKLQNISFLDIKSLMGGRLQKQSNNDFKYGIFSMHFVKIAVNRMHINFSLFIRTLVASGKFPSNEYLFDSPLSKHERKFTACRVAFWFGENLNYLFAPFNGACVNA